MQSTLCREGYFMSEESTDAVIGRVVREFKENSQRLEVLKAEAEKLAKYLSTIGEELKSNPERVHLPEDGIPADMLNWHRELVRASFDIDKISSLCREIRECNSIKAALFERKKNLGID